MKKAIKYSFRVLAWFFLSLIAILLLIILLIQTPPVKKMLADFASQKASSFINGKISINAIEGNFFTHLKLKDVLLTDNVDTLIHIAEVEALYDLLPLMYGKLEVHQLQMNSPSVFFAQLNDSTWNVQQIVKPTTPQESDTISSIGGTLAIYLGLFKINDGVFHIQDVDTLIPRRIQSFHTELSLKWTEKEQVIQLKNFSFLAQKPDLDFQKLSFELTKTERTIELKDFYLKTAKNKLEGTAEYEEQPNRTASAHLESSPLQLQEFESFLSGLQSQATPVFLLDASLQNDSVSATMQMEDQDQRIHLNVKSSNLIAFLQNKTHVLLDYKLKGDFKNIDLANWLGNSNLNYLINGKLLADGTGIDLETANCNVKGDFNNCFVQKQKVDQLYFTFDVQEGNVNGLAEGKGKFGEFKLQPNIQNINKVPAYNFELTARKLDLAQLSGNDSLRSDINMRANVTGKGFELKTLVADAKLVFSESSLYKLKLDTLLADVQYKNENITIDTLSLATQKLNLNASGNYSLQSTSDISLSAKFSGIDEFAVFFPQVNVQTSGQIDAALWGTLDSLNVHTTVALDESKYESFSLEKLKLTADAKLTKSDTIINARLFSENIENKEFQLDSLVVALTGEPDSLAVSAQLTAQDANTSLDAVVRLGQAIEVSFQDWIINIKNQHFELQQAPATIKIDSLNYYINNFRLASNSSDSAQYIAANGQISRSGQEDFKLEVTNVDIGELMQTLNPKVQASGLVDVNLNLKGTAESPLLYADVKWKNATVSNYQFTDFGVRIDYKDKRMNVEVQIVPQDSGKIELSGMLPFQFALDSIHADYSTKDSINALLRIEKFPLSVIKSFDIAEEINGYFDGEIRVNGTVESPNPEGTLQLKEAKVKIPEYGIDYRDIKFTMNFLRDKIQMDTLLIITDDGGLTGIGEMDFNSNFYKGDINNSAIKLQFDQFNPIDHRQFNMQLSGDASLGGKKGDVVFNGDLTIPEAEIYLPTILNMMGRMNAPEIPKPILIREMERMKLLMDTLATERIDSPRTDSIKFDYFNYLTGKAKLKIPKNTWIKNEDMRVELSGDLELIKHKNFFELFGSLEIVRGQYDLLGKTFMINEGTISFQGGEKLVSRMNITASYSFRNTQRAEQELIVTIRGTSESPSVSFTLDGSSVNEGDALSYILFGKGMNELTMDQQENVSGDNDFAETAAASILSSQLTEFLGDKLDVDYIEVKSEGGFENATVVVGKYITNDLFVSYEQRFGETDEKDMSKYEVKLEYELFQFLFLQLNNSSNDSGFDVIFKFNSKR